MKEIFILSPIGLLGENLDSIKDQLAGISAEEEILVHIDSPGGDVPAGFAIFNFFKGLPNKVITRIEGQAASISSIIALAGDRIEISETADLMIHNAWTELAGDHDKLRKTADDLEGLSDRLINVYHAKSGIPREELATMMDKETILDSKRALELGFVDAIVNSVTAMAMAKNRLTQNNIRMSNFEKFMARMGFKAETTTTETKVVKTDEPESLPVVAQEEEEVAPTPSPEGPSPEERMTEMEEQLATIQNTLSELTGEGGLNEKLEAMSQALFNLVPEGGENISAMVEKKINTALGKVTSTRQPPIAQEAGNRTIGGSPRRFSAIKDRQIQAGTKGRARARHEK